jgi:hypothetical protein
MRTLFALLVVLSVCPAALADTLRWTNPAGGAWDDPANWDLARVPNAHDEAVLDLPNAYTITVTGDPQIGRVQGPPSCFTADFDGDGDTGTDADIEAFFACLAGQCCANCAAADFNGDGDTGTDGDIESFFLVLAGSSC